MALRIVATRAVFLVALWGALVAAAIALDATLHVLGLAWIGLWLGPIGTTLILASFAYSFRKRGWFERGSPRALLLVHEALAWSGTLLVLVHAGIHVHALLPWLAVVAMLIAVASGLTGEFLLTTARARLSARAQELRNAGLEEATLQKRLQTDALVVRGMETWRVVHLPIAVNFAVLAFLHIVTAVLFW